MRRIFIIILVICLIMAQRISMAEQNKDYPQELINKLPVLTGKGIQDMDSLKSLQTIIIKIDLDKVQLEILGQNEAMKRKIDLLMDFIKQHPHSEATYLALYIICFEMEQLTTQNNSETAILEKIVRNNQDCIAAKAVMIDLCKYKCVCEVDKNKKRVALENYKEAINTFLKLEENRSGTEYYRIAFDILKVVWYKKEISPLDLPCGAKLKLELGSIYEQLGDKENATKYYQDIASNFKGSEIAKIAHSRIEKINQNVEG